MTRAGARPGALVSEVKNIHSDRVYFVSTAPEIGQDYWSTVVLPARQKKRLLGLLTVWRPDVYHQIATVIRNSINEAHRVHAEVQHIVTMKPEDDWLTFFPSPTPPDGLSEGARRKLKDTLGYDPLS
jgi:hypothetical protein